MSTAAEAPGAKSDARGRPRSSLGSWGCTRPPSADGMEHIHHHEPHSLLMNWLLSLLASGDGTALSAPVSTPGATTRRVARWNSRTFCASMRRRQPRSTAAKPIRRAGPNTPGLPLFDKLSVARIQPGFRLSSTAPRPAPTSRIAQQRARRSFCPRTSEIAVLPFPTLTGHSWTY